MKSKALRSEQTSADGHLNRLALGSTTLTKRTALVLSQDLRLEEWRRIGQQISVLSNAAAWWLGDWLIYGQKRYPDRYKRAIGGTGLDYQTLRNYAWVAGRFTPARRRARLSFQHHAEVAALSDQDQDTWLDEAERLSWSRNQLRDQIRAARKLAHQHSPAEVVRVLVDVPHDQIELWQHAANGCGQDLVEWMTTTLDQAAARPPQTHAGDADAGVRKNGNARLGHGAAIAAPRHPL